MKFDKIINSLLKEGLSREDRIKALKNITSYTDLFEYKGEFEFDFTVCCAFLYKGVEFSLLTCGDRGIERMKEKDLEMLEDLSETLDYMLERGALNVYIKDTKWGKLIWGWEKAEI